jgi:hypothetical protein
MTITIVVAGSTAVAGGTGATLRATPPAGAAGVEACDVGLLMIPHAASSIDATSATTAVAVRRTARRLAGFGIALLLISVCRSGGGLQ